MKFTIEIDPDLNPDAVGEFLRSSFFDGELGGYQTFDWQKDVVPLGRVEVDPEEEDNAFKLFWTRGKKTFAGKIIECRYYWDGDGTLVFELPDGKCLINDDCKKDYGWRLVRSVKDLGGL